LYEKKVDFIIKVKNTYWFTCNATLRALRKLIVRN